MLRSGLTLLLSGTLLLSACQTEVAVRRVPRATDASSPAVAQKKASPTPSPSAPALIAATPSPAPTPAPVEGARLIGTIKLDANYVITSGGANLISNGLGSVIALGGGNVIALGGGNVITAGGGNLITAGGGNVITAGGGNYRLAEAPSFPPGTMLPVEGLAVVPVSLTSGRVLTTGVKTDSTGAYSLVIPASEQGNVRLLVAVPGKSADDPVLSNPKLRYELLADPSRQAQHQDMDEVKALVYKYARRAMVNRFRMMLFGDPGTPRPGVEQILAQQLQSLNSAAAQRLKAAPLTEAQQNQVVQRVIDIALANTDLAHVAMNPLVSQAYAPGLAQDAFLDEAHTRKVVTAMDWLEFALSRMQAGAIAHFDEVQQGFAQSWEEVRNGLPGVPYTHKFSKLEKLEKPADLEDYIIDEYLSQSREDAIVGVGLINEKVGARDHIGSTMEDLLTGAGGSIVIALVQTIQSNAKYPPGRPGPGANELIAEVIAHYDPAAKAGGAPLAN